MLLWFVATAVLTVHTVFRDPRFDHRWLIVGVLLPDVVDVWFGGARVLHSVTGAVIVLTVVMLATIGRRPLRKRLVSLVMPCDDPTITLWGNEPVFRDGRLAGYTSSAAYSPTLSAAVAMAYIKRPPEESDLGVDTAWLETGRYEILQDGVKYPARMTLRSPVDPARERILR